MKKPNSKPKSTDITITIGIDLGTTNSEVAISRDGKTEIIKNAQQDEYTPSVFGIDKAKNKVVGRKAYERLYKSTSEEEFNNYKAEVKRLMGTEKKVSFERIKTKMLPEEIAGEILKSQREDISRKYPDFSTLAAVITVPAHFSILQAEATKRAGYLAGFKYVVLLQEPIAAAMAYGFDNTANQNWLVYDLGGGTFDVALISSKDGLLTVLGHNGNNFLGGKDFDWLVVEEIIKPVIIDKFNLSEFDRSNTKYQIIFSKLKSLAETAKIELSQFDKTTIEVDEIGKDDDGNDIYASIDLTRKEFENLIQPAVEETIKLSEKTLKESRVTPTSVDRVVLVGGPTQIPFIKKALENNFKIEIDISVDPLTVVAKGACIFGLSQRVPIEFTQDSEKSKGLVQKITLNYDPMTSEDEQTVTGRVEDLKGVDEEYHIQIQSDSGYYTSAKISLKNGNFYDEISIEKGKDNLYWLYLFDSKGNEIPIEPDSFKITHGLSVAGSPIPHSIGVIYAKKEFDSGFQLTEVCDVYFEKNSVPPLDETRFYKTLRKLVKGKDNQLPIKVYEGESKIPDRNEIITTLVVDGKKLPYDLPENTSIEIRIIVDESRSVSIEAFIPSVDLTLPARADTYGKSADTKKLVQDLIVQKERLKKIETNVEKTEYEQLEKSLNTVLSNIKNADTDEDDKKKAERDLKELKKELDEIEQDKKMPQLKEEFESGLDSARSVGGDLGDEDEKVKVMDQLDILQKEGEKAIAKDDKVILIRVNTQIKEVTFRCIFMDPAAWVWQLNEIKDKREELTNKDKGEKLIEEADKAVENSNFEELKRCVRGLLEILPEDTQDEITSNMSGITK